MVHAFVRFLPDIMLLEHLLLEHMLLEHMLPEQLLQEQSASSLWECSRSMIYHTHYMYIILLAIVQIVKKQVDMLLEHVKNVSLSCKIIMICAPDLCMIPI